MRMNQDHCRLWISAIHFEKETRKTFRNLFISRTFQFCSVSMVHVQIANRQTNSVESREKRKNTTQNGNKSKFIEIQTQINAAQIQALIVQTV